MRSENNNKAYKGVIILKKNSSKKPSERHEVRRDSTYTDALTGGKLKNLHTQIKNGNATICSYVREGRMTANQHSGKSLAVLLLSLLHFVTHFASSTGTDTIAQSHAAALPLAPAAPVYPHFDAHKKCVCTYIGACECVRISASDLRQWKFSAKERIYKKIKMKNYNRFARITTLYECVNSLASFSVLYCYCTL